MNDDKALQVKVKALVSSTPNFLKSLEEPANLNSSTTVEKEWEALSEEEAEGEALTS